MYNAAAWSGFVNTLSVNTEALNEAAAKSLLVSTAITARDRVLNGTPKPTGYRQIVDGADGAPLNAVRADGMIVFAWQYLGLIVAEILEMLIQAAPALTGDYIRSILLLADGVPANADAIGAGTKQVTLVPTVPYARRIEVGKRKDGSPFVVHAKPHLVETTTAAARRLYGTLVSIEFNHVELPGGGHRLAAHSRSIRRTRRGVIAEIWYPAIVIAPKTF